MRTPRLSAVLIFLAGLASPFSVRVIGLLFYGEILLMVVALWALCTTAGDRKFWSRAFLLSLACISISLIGYIISDLIWKTDADEFLKGWSRFIFLASSLTGIWYLTRNRKQSLVHFFVGYSLAELVLELTDPLWLSNWKFGLAMPLTVLVLALLPAISRNPLLISLTAGAISLVHILLDYRSLGAICLIIAIVLFPRAGRARRRRSFITLQMVAAGIGIAVFGYLYIVTDEIYAARRMGSNGWRVSAFHTAWYGISKSPWIGYGSWVAYNAKENSSEFSSVFDQEYSGRRETEMGNIVFDANVFVPHSQLLQAWFEGGVLALTFFIYLGYRIFKGLFFCVFNRGMDRYTPLFLLRLLLAAWDLFFSPFTGPMRLNIAAVLVITYLLDAERKAVQRREFLGVRTWAGESACPTLMEERVAVAHWHRNHFV